MSEPTSRARPLRAGICIAVALLTSCAGSAPRNWLDRVIGTSGVGPPRAAYAAVDRAKVYSAPDDGASVEGLLKLHEKVERYQSERGFAYVEAEGNLSGWVREQQLVLSRPRARAPADATRPAATPSPETATPAEAPPGSSPDAETPPDEEPLPAPDEAPEPSVFDPY